MARGSYRFSGCFSGRFSSGLLATAILSISGAAFANDQSLADSARSSGSAQDWFNYLTQCDVCDERDEALGQLQQKQYEANGDLIIEGAASESAGDGALLELARKSNNGQDWYNYLSTCGSCEARGEALGAIQSLQLAANGELKLEAPKLNSNGGGNAGALSAPDFAVNSGDENSLREAAINNGSAADWYSYLVGCSSCDERDTALNAMQQLQYASHGDAFNSDISWAPGESLTKGEAKKLVDADLEADNTGTVAETETNMHDGGDDGASDGAAEEDAEIAAVLADAAEAEATAEAEAAEAAALAAATAAAESAAAKAKAASAAKAEPEITAVKQDWSEREGDSWELALEISGHSRAVWRVAFSPVAPILASASGDRSVLLYDLNDRKIAHRLTGHQGYVNAIAFSPDGTLLASGGGDHAIIIWDVATGAALRILQAHNGDINALAWSASGKLLVSGADDGRVVVWNAADGKQVTTLAGGANDVTALTISPDENTVATAGSDGFVYLYSSQTGEQNRRLNSHDGYTFDLVWSADGATLSSAGSDGAIRKWQLNAGSDPMIVAQQSQALTGIELSANGKYIASSSFDGNVVIRDAGNYNTLQTISAYPGSAYSVSMTGDGRFVAAAGGVNFIRVWRR